MAAGVRQQMQVLVRALHSASQGLFNITTNAVPSVDNHHRNQKSSGCSATQTHACTGYEGGKNDLPIQGEGLQGMMLSAQHDAYIWCQGKCNEYVCAHTQLCLCMCVSC